MAGRGAFTQAISSELRRARHTAEIVLGQRELVIQPDGGFNEMNFGDWEMRHHQDLQREDSAAWADWVADWQLACPPAGSPFHCFHIGSANRPNVC